MTGDVPPLPASDDPHELLDVSESADEETLKRAYVALIKVYRPDRHPEEFQRIRRAYEQALEWLAIHEAAADEDDATPDLQHRLAEFVEHQFPDGIEIREHVFDVGGDAPESEASPSSGPQLEAWARTWGDLRDGRCDEVRARLARATEEAPRDADAWRQRFLFEEWAGTAPAEAVTVLAEGIEAGAELAGWALTVLEHDVLPLAARLSWPVLSGQRDREDAARMFDARLVAEVTHGGVVPFLEELRARPFLEDARRVEALRWVALRAAGVAAFEAPEASDELFERLAREPFEDGSVEESFAARRSLRKEWGAIAAAAPDAPALRAFLAACHSLHPVDLATLGLVDAVSAEPDTYLDAFDALVDRAPGLYRLYLEGVELCLETQPDDAFHDEGRDERLAVFVGETDRALEKDRGNRADSFLGGALVVGTVYVFVAFAWWGLLPLASTFVWLLVNVSRVDRRLYRDIVRPRALDVVVEREVTPEDLVRAVKAHTKLSDDIGRFDGELTEDLGLHALALALRTDPREGEGA